ncbi:MAG: phosphatidate cytidylyltransferase [Endomicrobiia bacterium]
MVLPRIITAIIGIPLILITVYYGGGLYLIMLFVVLLFMIREYVFMTKSAGYETSFLGSLVTGTTMFTVIIIEQLSFIKTSLYLTSIVVTMIIFILFFIEILRQEPVGAVGRIGVSFIGPMLFGWSLAHMFLIRDIRPRGMEYTFILILTIWICDTASYIFGVLWGKKKLVQNISPKKSVVGLIAGLFTGMFSVVLLQLLFKIEIFSIKQASLIGFGIAFFTAVSDLSESLIKRDCGFKDSDNLLPGHGGMMDRFDSFLFTAPLYFYFLRYFLDK